MTIFPPARFSWLLPLSIVLSFFSFSLPANAQQWPRFRGPNGTGMVADAQLPAQWSKADYRWTAKLPGMGHSSPVVWKDRLFLLSADADTATRYVLCYDANSGEQLWNQQFPSEPHHLHPRNSFASSTPAVDEKLVYVAWSIPEATTFMALTHDGEIAWQRDLGKFDSSHGFGTSPIVVDDLAILGVQQRKPTRTGPRTNDSFIIAVNKHTGKTQWKTQRWSESAAYSVPFLYPSRDAQDRELIFCSTAHGIFSLNPKTGTQNWAIDVFSMRTVSSPVATEGLIFGSTGSGGGGNYVVAVKPGPDPSIAYEVKKSAPYVPSVIAKDGMVFLWSDEGIVQCVRAGDGKVLWQKRVGGNFSGSPVIAGDKLYCVDDDGVVVVLAADDQYKLLGRNPLGEFSRSTPAIANNTLYLRTYSQLFAVQ